MKKRIRLPIFILIITGVLCIWTYHAKSDEHYTPDYVMEDLAPYLEKNELTEADYRLLYKQTGLGRKGVEELWKRGERETLLYLQERFFAKVEVDCENSWFLYNESIVSYGENLYGENFQWDTEDFLPVVEDGDILITFSSHFLGWRNGHAALVIDAGKGMTLEARNMASDSAVMYLSNWQKRPSFILLRLKDASPEIRSEIARYAGEHLVGIPYQLTAITSVKGKGEKSTNTTMIRTQPTASAVEETLQGTQCAHLVWYAYNAYGYDLRVGKEHIITPYRLLQSPLLETIQVYGFEF